jgi:hypothetical protein
VRVCNPRRFDDSVFNQAADFDHAVHRKYITEVGVLQVARFELVQMPFCSWLEEGQQVMVKNGEDILVHIYP